MGPWHVANPQCQLDYDIMLDGNVLSNLGMSLNFAKKIIKWENQEV